MISLHQVFVLRFTMRSTDVYYNSETIAGGGCMTTEKGGTTYRRYIST